MAHFHIKKKKGRPYLYVREIARVHGKPKVVSQIYIGSPKATAALAAGERQEEIKLRVEEFGALWLAHQMDMDIDLASIVDSVIPQKKREKGPTVGEYFLYCVWNRMIKAKSKNKLAEWYRRSAIQQIRPVKIDDLTSQRYWEKWDRISEKNLETIARKFFERVWEVESPDGDCLLFDTTNYYTFMASDTKSHLARRGNNKAGRHHLRQVGLGLLVARNSRLPLYYCTYPGNRHDSRLFEDLMDEMFGAVSGLNRTQERLTVVIDKGMNSEGNYTWIDDHENLHFITTYSTYFAEDLATISLEYFEVVDTAGNQRLVEENKPEEQLLAFRTKGEYWGRERTVVVTCNPRTARKQSYTLDSKIEKLRGELFAMRRKVRERAPHWRDPNTVRERYFRLCEHLHISSDLFDIDFSQSRGSLSMRFQKNAHLVERKHLTFGKSIIITDNVDWTTARIVEANLDRWQVEDRFRQSKDDELVGAQPLRHWTDSKIRCHLFTCVAAMTYLRRLELRLKDSGVNRTAEDVMDDMQHFHSVLSLASGRSKPRRRLETPTKLQSEVLSSFGYRVDKKGVLQPLAR